MRKKLRSRRGETLSETLVAVLIVALSTVILATMTAASARLDRSADQVTAQFYDELTAAEACNDDDGAPGSVRLSGALAGGNTDVPVTFYGLEDGLTAYRRAGGGAP